MKTNLIDLYGVALQGFLMKFIRIEWDNMR